MSGTDPIPPVPFPEAAPPVLDYAARLGRRRLFRAETAAQSFSVYLPAMAIYRGLGLVRGLVLTWLMTQQEFGLLQIALFAINVLMPLCNAGTYEGLARYVPMYETRGTLARYLARVLPTVLALALVLSAALCLASRPLGQLLFASVSGAEGRTPAGQVLLTCIMGAMVLALAAYFILLAILRGMRMFRAVSLMELLSNIGFTVVAITAAALGARSADAVVLCYLATTAAVLPLFALPLRRVVHEVPPPPAQPVVTESSSRPIAQLLRFSVWAAVAAIMWQMLQYYPLWYLQKVAGPQSTAVFGGVRQMAQVVLVATVAVTTVVMTAVTKTWEAQGRTEAERKLALAFKTGGLLLIVICAGISALSPAIIRVLPRSYALGAQIIPASLLFFLICSHLSFLGIHFNLIEKPRLMFWPWTVGVICNIAFGRLLIRPGMPEADALHAAAMSAVLAGAGALLTCLVLLRLERRPMDVGAYILLAASFVLLLPIPILVAGALVMLIVARRTGVVFTPEEKAQRRAYFQAARTKLAKSR